ncbi:hypothetical protein FIBSPDRAFT_858413 [Athelia psychrophila]|uniref:Uncharacterized protein n=1 Tax=Athelia psychrophila TaxID=1759441 RepID=A0A166LYJ3_9AGAM|nr:hypothetical protein FIBSPDRAFT_858413 [Fibularhizoctonia sp. CBS 109695]
MLFSVYRFMDMAIQHIDYKPSPSLNENGALILASAIRPNEAIQGDTPTIAALNNTSHFGNSATLPQRPQP